jgi:quercetin dioxygenase-like cupin family protein
VFKRFLIVLTSSFAVLCWNTFGAGLTNDHVRIDNDKLRVLVVTSEAGAKSDWHEHRMNRVMIYLDPGQMKLTDRVGETTTFSFKAGEALWSPATIRPHVSLNLSERPVRIVEIELKAKADAPTPATLSPLDWAKVDPKHCKVEIENDQVRVIRARYGPLERGVMHEHPLHFVAVFLTEVKMSVTTPDGKSKIATAPNGTVVWGEPATHLEENLNDQPLEVVVVEIKK